MAIGEGAQRHPVHSAHVGRPRALHRAGRDPEPTGRGARGRRPRQHVSRGPRARGRRGRRRPSIGSDAGNLLARLPATSQNGGVPIFLCAHLDTVPPTAAIEPVVEDGVVRNAGGTILGADNKAAVARSRRPGESWRRTGPRGHRAALHPEGGGRAPGGQGFRCVAAARRHGLRLRSGSTHRRSRSRRAVRESDRGGDPRQGRSRRHGARGRPIRDRRRLPRHRRPPPRPARRRDDRERRPHHGRNGEEHRPRAVLLLDRRPVSLGAEALGLVREILETITLQRRSSSARRRPRSRRATAATGSTVATPVALACAALRRAGVEPQLGLTGGADANVFNERGKACVNLANGMMEIHTPGRAHRGRRPRAHGRRDARAGRRGARAPHTPRTRPVDIGYGSAAGRVIPGRVACHSALGAARSPASARSTTT